MDDSVRSRPDESLLDLLHLEVLVDTVTLLGDGLGEELLEERLLLGGDVDVLGVGEDEEGCGVALRVVSGLDGTVLAVDSEVGESHDPVVRVRELHEEEGSDVVLTVQLEEGEVALGDWGGGRRERERRGREGKREELVGGEERNGEKGTDK